MTGFDVIVIGGGLVGSAIAYGVAREGLCTALLDEGDVAYHASRGNFGLVWVQSKGGGHPVTSVGQGARRMNGRRSRSGTNGRVVCISLSQRVRI